MAKHCKKEHVLHCFNIFLCDPQPTDMDNDIFAAFFPEREGGNALNADVSMTDRSDDGY